MEDATAGPNNKTKNNSILLFRMGRMVCFGLLRAAGPTPKANKFFHFSLRKRNWKEFYLIEGWRRSRSVDEWMICFLLAGLIGGLWALQRQWLRQREQTAGERELVNECSWKQRQINGVEWTQRKAILFHQSIFVKLIEEKNAAASASEWNEMEGRSAAQSGLKWINLNLLGIDERKRWCLLFSSSWRERQASHQSIKEVDWMIDWLCFLSLNEKSCWLWLGAQPSAASEFHSVN